MGWVQVPGSPPGHKGADLTSKPPLVGDANPAITGTEENVTSHLLNVSMPMSVTDETVGNLIDAPTALESS